MAKIIQLIPYDGIGGVEEAARSMQGASRGGIVFSLRWIFPKVKSARKRWATYNPMQIIVVGAQIAREAPDVLVVSLWRAAMSGVVAKLLAPRTKLVLFVHNSNDAHFLDFFFTRLALRFATAVWADSTTAVRLRFKKSPKQSVKIISFLFRRIAPLEAGYDPLPRPVFVFWGRLASQKNLSRALRIFYRIRSVRPDARFHIIGPDGGEEHKLRALVAELGLEANVTFLGPLSFNHIAESVRGASFYLQSSRYEGMAVSVTEAMQMGLVPVVTPVGEIERYCRSDENAVIIHEDAQAAEDIIAILDAPQKYAAMRRQDLSTWANTPLYGDSVFQAAEDLLAS